MTQPGPEQGRPAPTHPEPASIGRQITEDIERTLHHRRAPPGTLRARAEDRVKRAGGRVFRGLRKRPSVGVLVFGGLAIAAADAVGVGELAMGIAIGYGAWQVLRKGKTIDEAIRDVERMDR